MHLKSPIDIVDGAFHCFILRKRNILHRFRKCVKNLHF